MLSRSQGLVRMHQDRHYPQSDHWRNGSPRLQNRQRRQDRRDRQPLAAGWHRSAGDDRCAACLPDRHLLLPGRRTDRHDGRGNQEPRRGHPPSDYSIPWRIAIFYIGTLVVLLSLFSWDQFGPGQSPFVKGFGQIGIPAAASVMNFVVLASALSSCSGGRYSNGRLLKKLADDGLAPPYFRTTNGEHVPAAAIIASAAGMAVGVPINALVPEQAFSYVTSVAAIGAIWAWGVIVSCHLVSCHLVYRRRVELRAGARQQLQAAVRHSPVLGVAWLPPVRHRPALVRRRTASRHLRTSVLGDTPGRGLSRHPATSDSLSQSRNFLARLNHRG